MAGQYIVFGEKKQLCEKLRKKRSANAMKKAGKDLLSGWAQG